jgi:hypothetical protein
VGLRHGKANIVFPMTLRHGYGIHGLYLHCRDVASQRLYNAMGNREVRDNGKNEGNNRKKRQRIIFLGSRMILLL